MKFAKFLAFIFAVMVVGSVIRAMNGDSATSRPQEFRSTQGWQEPRATTSPREQIIATSPDINAVAQALAAGSASKTTATIERGRVSVTIDLDPIGFIWVSRQNFWGHVQTMVPKIFERFPEARVIRVTGTATARDMRGNDTKGPAIWLEFSREDAARVNWRNVDRSNLPLIATAEWSVRAFKD